MNKKGYALITGASGGIGFALAKKFAAAGYNLLLTARNGDKLNANKNLIEKEYNVDVEIFISDLANENSPSSIYSFAKENNLSVSILVNNAGFNEVGKFINTDLKKEMDLIRVVVSASVELCKLFIPDMKKISYGRIVNVCSTGAFFPTPNNAIYCATKTFLYNFSTAIRHELRKTGIKVSALCPGATLTNFPLEAEINDSRLFKIFPMTPEKVANLAFPQIIRGKRKIITGLYNKILVNSSVFYPSWIMNPMIDWMYKAS